MRKRILIPCVAMLLVSGVAHAQDAYIELLKSDVRAMKRVIVEEIMDLTEAEAGKFWPIYDKYANKLHKINDARLELIRDYAEHWGAMSDGRAKKIAKRAMDLDMKQVYLQREFFRKFDYVLPTVKAVKFLQLERQIELLIRLQIASELPLIE